MNRPRLQVLVVDDEASIRDLLRMTLEAEGYGVHEAATMRDGLTLAGNRRIDLFLLDLGLPDGDGVTLVRQIRSWTQRPILVLSARTQESQKVDALDAGADDYVTKPFAADRLVQCVRRAAEKRKLVLENRRLREAVQDEDQGDVTLLGQTPVMQRLRNTIRQIADTDVDVLLTGETGTGKEVVASLLHRWSSRSKGNFVALNCGALPEQILESELFGHETGAFTGAQKRRVGRIEHSSGGTLFLDEIESMPPVSQIQMLRVLEMREVTPLGTNEVRPVDLRVIAAAKVDLGNPQERRDFREDLYYRLNVVSLFIPPLRERRDDVPLLFRFFCQRAAKRFNREVPPLTISLNRHLQDHTWPGNVRELNHFAERFVLGLETLTHDTLMPEAEVMDRSGTLPDRMAKIEAELIREALQANDGDVKRTIEALGIPRKTFYDKLQRHGISRATFVNGS